MAQIPLRKWSEFSLSDFSTRFGWGYQNENYQINFWAESETKRSGSLFVCLFVLTPLASLGPLRSKKFQKMQTVHCPAKMRPKLWKSHIVIREDDEAACALLIHGKLFRPTTSASREDGDLSGEKTFAWKPAKRTVVWHTRDMGRRKQHCPEKRAQGDEEPGTNTEPGSEQLGKDSDMFLPTGQIVLFWRVTRCGLAKNCSKRPKLTVK